MKRLVVAAVIAWLMVCSVKAEDYFDQYPGRAKSAGVQKLSSKERASMASLIDTIVVEAMIEAVSSQKKTCEGQARHSCEKARQTCREVCLNNTVWDFEAGMYRHNTNLGDICLGSCESAKTACQQQITNTSKE
jgi:hypothetical protein